MNLKALLLANTVDEALVKQHYLEKIKDEYVDYEVFIPIDDSDFIIFRKKVGESRFGEKPNVFTVNITTDIKIHYTQLHKLINR
jgi:hypothetical protein